MKRRETRVSTELLEGIIEGLNSFAFEGPLDLLQKPMKEHHSGIVPKLQQFREPKAL